MREMTRVSFRLLEVFALGLGLDPKALDHMFEPSHTSFLRLNYYVSLTAPCNTPTACLPGQDCGSPYTQCTGTVLTGCGQKVDLPDAMNMYAYVHAEQTPHRYCLVRSMPRWLQTQWAPTLRWVCFTVPSAYTTTKAVIASNNLSSLPSSTIESDSDTPSIAHLVYGTK